MSGVTRLIATLANFTNVEQAVGQMKWPKSMVQRKTMSRATWVPWVLVLALLSPLSDIAWASDGTVRNGEEPVCSVRSLAGRWLFATDVGQFPAFGGDITALGTMNIDKNGRLEGKFDATVGGVAFLPDNTYSGTLVVNSNCTGILTFVTSRGTVRTDSIAVVSWYEMWGMSQDLGNLWTYRVRRISVVR